MMKKLVALFLCAALLCGAAVFAGAEEPTTGGYSTGLIWDDWLFSPELNIRLSDLLAYKTPFSLGDVDGDGLITAADARLVLRYSVGIENLTEQQKRAADIFLNGSIDSANARKLMRIAVGLDIFDEIELFVTISGTCFLGPLKNVGNGTYNWSCTVEPTLRVTQSDTDARGEAIDPQQLQSGTESYRTFAIECYSTGTYTVKLRLGSEDEVLKEVQLTIHIGLTKTG